jgi:hypothetical protein
MQVFRKGWAYQAIVKWGRKLLEVEPDVEGACGRNVDFEMKRLEPCKNVVAFCFEMLLKSKLEKSARSCSETCISQYNKFSYFLLLHMKWVQ